jgi:FkbM family methyltransferase
VTVKHQLRKLALRLGLEVRRYNASESEQARLFRQMQTHRIDAVIDVGANDGGYGRFLRAGGFGGAILSFEPLSAAHAALTLAASPDPHWHVAPRMALGEVEGTADIHVAGNSTSSSLLPMKALHVDAAPQSKYVGIEQVPVGPLDGVRHAAIDKASRILLKIDTQGYEMPVLRGAAALLRRVIGVQLELSLAPLYEGQALYREIIDTLSDAGLELWNVLPGFVDPTSGRMLQFDGVFFRAGMAEPSHPRD